MSVPLSVQSLLRQQNIAYEASAVPMDETDRPRWHDQHLRDMSAAKSVILQDAEGSVQVIHAADSLLDLKAVNRHMGRELKAATSSHLRDFLAKQGVTTVPAIPQSGFVTLVDKHLLQRHDVWLDSGSGQEIIKLSQDEFARMVESAQICDIAIPFAELEHPISRDKDAESILGAVRNFTQLRVKQRLEETLELPPLSDTASRIIKLRSNPNADISDLAQIVETDPSLAAQVVSWAASPYYSAPGKIRSIHDAIVRVLGFDMVLNLALGLSLGRSLAMPKKGAHGVYPYWQQAVYMAATIEALVAIIPRDHRPSFGLSYLCGLLHNFGYLILAEVFPPYFQVLCDLEDANPHVNDQVIERYLLGITRDQLAGSLMTLWNMPDEVAQGVRHQSEVNYQGPYQQYANLVLVAKRLLLQHNIGRGPKLEIPQSIFDSLHLDRVKAEATVVNVLESSEELRLIANELNVNQRH